MGNNIKYVICDITKTEFGGKCRRVIFLMKLKLSYYQLKYIVITTRYFMSASW